MTIITGRRGGGEIRRAERSSSHCFFAPRDGNFSVGKGEREGRCQIASTVLHCTVLLLPFSLPFCQSPFCNMFLAEKGGGVPLPFLIADFFPGSFSARRRRKEGGKKKALGIIAPLLLFFVPREGGKDKRTKRIIAPAAAAVVIC